MIFLLNFTQFDAIIANFETHFAYFETKIPDRFGRGYSHLQAHTGRCAEGSQHCRCNRYNQLRDKLNSLSFRHHSPPFLITVTRVVGVGIDHGRRIVVVIIVVATGLRPATTVGTAVLIILNIPAVA